MGAEIVYHMVTLPINETLNGIVRFARNDITTDVNTTSSATKVDSTVKQSLLSNALPSSLFATLPEKSQVFLGTVVVEIQDVLGRFIPVSKLWTLVLNIHS